MSRVILALALCITVAEYAQAAKLRAGASAVDITPTEFPVIVNGMFEERTATRALDPIFAKCIVLEDGTTKIAMVVGDSCMFPRDLLDQAKEIASKSTGIPTDRMMISATHTHSAPSSMGCLGSDPDVKYQRFVVPLLAKAIERASANLQPARVGWAVAKAPDYTACRRWIFAPNQMRNDPFGFQTVRANMHPGYQNAGAMGPAGPTDPDLSMLAVQSADGKPLALLANFSMHYFGSGIVSSDYFGLFAKKFATLANADEKFVGIMSQGTSGDAWWGDYSKPAAKKWTIDEYSQGMAQIAFDAYSKIEYRDDVPIAMKESKLALRYRVADEKRLAWAKERVAALNGKKPTVQPDIYAREQVMLAENPDRELKLQAIRIGDFAMAAIPNEVYALTGLKIKGQSPSTTTMVIELANGAEGYIPPPEQHKLGGYTTWAARTAGLEVQAEPKIVEAILGLLEELRETRHGNFVDAPPPRRTMADKSGPYVQAIISARPLAYFRMDQAAQDRAGDIMGNAIGSYEEGVVFYLEGPQPPEFVGSSINHCPHFAGGRLATKLKNIKNQYSIELWFYNCLSLDARAVTGYIFSRGPDGAEDCPGDHVGIGGTATSKGKIIFFNGNKRNEILSGNTDIPIRTWNHLVITRDGRRVTMYLNGNPEPEAVSDVDITYPAGADQFFIGGRSDNFANFEGKIDEVAIYDRALKPEEVADHFKASGMPARKNAEALKRDSDPKPPEEALALLHVKNGYVIEQVAAEPLIVDPVAFDWGADGRLWVVEMHDYPNGMDGKMKPGGRIKVLEDTDGDGKYDKSTLFLDNINMPNGIITWRNGAIITAAPEIFYAEDSDGDGKADVRKTLYKGFKEGNPQLRINSLRFGLDNWIHCANGWSGGVIQSWKGDTKLDLGRKDLRIRPDEGLMELESGVTQYGRNPDDWGNWFGCDNSHPLFHYVLEDRYLRRNPHVTPPDSKQQVITTANPKVYPLSREGKRYHSFEHAGHYTSACSAMIYRDELLFPRGDAQHSFTCEPVHNLVQHNIVRESGSTFTSIHPDDETDHDFVASEDPWFRPVMVRTGPDGAMWIADMYRYMIEHPEWLPPQGKAELMKFYRDGDDRGRIYRVYPKDKKPRAIPNLSSLNTKELVALLGYPNGWVRDKAQQMLIWKNDAAAISRLEDLIFKSKVPQARLHALCTLDALSALQDADIRMALEDEHPAVRRAAVRIVEISKRLPDFQSAMRLIDDPDSKVRLQLACSLGEWDGAKPAEGLAKLALAPQNDPYINGAIASSLLKHYPAVAQAWLAAKRPPAGDLYRDLLTMCVATDNRWQLDELLAPLLAKGENGYTAQQLQTLSQWLESASQRSNFAQFAQPKDSPLAQLLRGAGPLYEDATKLAVDPSQPADLRAAAASLLGRRMDRLDEELKVLSSLLTPQTPAEVQLAAVKSSGRIGGSRVSAMLLGQWPSFSPAVRVAVADLLLARETSALDLLHALESGKVAPADLDVQRRERLSKHSSAKVKELAKTVLKTTETNRQDVVDANRSVLSMTGDRARGAKMFATHCATCHRMENVGTEIGPGLVSVTNWSGEALLTAILDPDRQVEPRYLSYTAKLNNNDEIFGIITAESGGGITMKGLDGKDQNILRSNLKSLTCTNHSLMPMGFEQAMSKQELADLISYLQTSH